MTADVTAQASGNGQDYQGQIELAKKLLKTVRHAAYATVNEDGTPHNSPLMLIYNEDLTRLYIGSYSDSLHVKNMLRTGQVFAVVYDSFTKGQGGVYIACVNARECEDDELVEALRVHNKVRAKQGSAPIDMSYYKADKPSQRMYALDIAKVEIYSANKRADGLMISEARVAVKPSVLLEEQE